MYIENLVDMLDSKISDLQRIPITVHTGGNNWEEIVDVVYCQGCNQYHIISERFNGNSSRKGKQDTTEENSGTEEF